MHIFKTFECSDQISIKFCHSWNKKVTFLQILHHSSVSWDITRLYLFNWNVLYFQQKDPIKIQIWWNWKSEILQLDGLLKLTWNWFEQQTCRPEFSPNHSKLRKCNLDEIFLSKVFDAWAETYRGVSFTTFKGEASKMALFSLKNGTRNTHYSTQKFVKLYTDGLFLPKACNFSAIKFHRICFMTLNDNVKFNGKLTHALKSKITNLLKFHATVESLQTFTLIGSVCLKHVRI